MAHTSSLSRMSVPLVDQSEGNGLLHPKLKYRFRILFENIGDADGSHYELTKQVVTASRPDLQHDKITIDVYNSKVFLVGKHTWQPLSITLRDDARGDVHKAIGQQLQQQVDHYNQSSAVSGQDYKFTTRLQILDGFNGANEGKMGDGGILEDWELLGCFIESSNYNELDYSQSDVITIQLSLSFDNALQHKLEKGIGAPMTRDGKTGITGVGAPSTGANRGTGEMNMQPTGT